MRCEGVGGSGPRLITQQRPQPDGRLAGIEICTICHCMSARVAPARRSSGCMRCSWLLFAGLCLLTGWLLQSHCHPAGDGMGHCVPRDQGPASPGGHSRSRPSSARPLRSNGPRCSCRHCCHGAFPPPHPPTTHSAHPQSSTRSPRGTVSRVPPWPACPSRLFLSSKVMLAARRHCISEAEIRCCGLNPLRRKPTSTSGSSGAEDRRREQRLV